MSETKKQQYSMFIIEENVTRAFALMQNQIFYFIKGSKFTIGEISEKIGMDRATLSKKLKEKTLTAKQFYDLLNLLNTELSDKLPEETKKE